LDAVLVAETQAESLALIPEADVMVCARLLSVRGSVLDCRDPGVKG
jgi:hypothetical protein